MRKVLLCLYLMACVSCSSKSVPSVSYYTLAPAKIVNNAVKQIHATPINAVISKVVVADYLQSRNLVMQQEGPQLYYSNSHFWAEDLQKGFAKALVTQLYQQQSAYNFADGNLSLRHPTAINVVVQVEHFVPTSNGNVVLSGSYWIYSGSDTERPVANETFQFSDALADDGFAHAVTKLQGLVTKLSEDILTRVNVVQG